MICTEKTFICTENTYICTEKTYICTENTYICTENMHFQHVYIEIWGPVRDGPRTPQSAHMGRSWTALVATKCAPGGAKSELDAVKSEARVARPRPHGVRAVPVRVLTRIARGR